MAESAAGEPAEDDVPAENATEVATDGVTATTTSSSLIPSVLPPMTKMQISLLETLSDMTVRSEVQECINMMLMDVEVTFYLQQDLELQAAKHSMETVTKHHQATILEANAEREAREGEHLVLADQMVQQVMILSREMEELLQWKRDHAHKVEEYEGLVVKLSQLEDDLETAQERAQHLAKLEREGNDSPDSGSSKLNEKAKSRVKERKVKSPKIKNPNEELPAALVADGSSDTPEKPISSADPEIASVASQEEEPTEDANPDMDGVTSPVAVVESPAAAAVTLDADEPEEEVPGLVQVDVEILMAVFGFLDAMDILNLAQINLSMYSKIDNIFGISEDGQSPPQPTRPSAAAAPATIRSQIATPTLAMKQEPSPASGSASNGGPAASAVASGPIGNRLFSMLQPARTGPGAKKTSQALNPSVAQSMASKLTDIEIAAILSMTDKLNKMDKELTVLRTEKEAMTAKLDGTEAVKQFLINKVRDVEMKLAQSRDDEIKVTQQIASDQEVIAFLDSRVQELERQTETLTIEKSRAQSELDTTKVQTSKKITMLSDMLKYEREKLKDEEGEWKATKKVLVREVKNCRAQILALQAERDGLKEQNEMLKRAIVSTGKSARATSPLR